MLDVQFRIRPQQLFHICRKCKIQTHAEFRWQKWNWNQQRSQNVYSIFNCKHARKVCKTSCVALTPPTVPSTKILRKKRKEFNQYNIKAGSGININVRYLCIILYTMQIYHITNQREKNTETLQQHFSFITIRITRIYKRCHIYIHSKISVRRESPECWSHSRWIFLES